MRYCFCVAGWYFYEDFFASLYSMDGDKYVVSHRYPAYFEAAAIPEQVRRDLIVFENRGLDWGLYHQFKERVDLSPYDFVIFIHDDVVIKDTTFPRAIIEKLRNPAVQVVGNGRNGTDWEFRFGKYRRRMFWQEEDDNFIVRTVRGSFFAARTSIFERIGNFPVYWPARPAKQNKGNYSLRNFGYVISKTFGRESIVYLDDEHYLDTPYLSELVRGEQRTTTS